MRRYWNNFITDTCVLVFVVDSTDSEKRLSLAFDEFHKLLGDDRLKKIPFVIVAAKQVRLLNRMNCFDQSLSNCFLFKMCAQTFIVESSL